MDSKPVYLSKTFWIALILAIVPLWPAANVWIQANPTVFAEVLAGIFFVLRLVSKDKITIL